MLHARIAARAFNTPLLVEPSKAMAFLSGLGPRILGRQVELVDGSDHRGITAATLPASTSLLAGGLVESARQHGDAPYVLLDGIAVIEIAGVLIHRGGWIGESSGQTTYEGIAAQIEAAASDPSVRGVALEIDSFGGEVAGVFDLADRIRALRRDKPVWAFVAEHAFSAGYALASQATRILLPRTGGLGSIGVVVMHADLSGQLDQDGMRVTLIHAGSHKVDGNPYAPLPEAVRGDIQREIEMLRCLFAETVAAGRAGCLSRDAALATEAATYRGAEAVAAGLADEVIDLRHGFAAFRQLVAGTPATSLARVPHTPLTQTPNPTQTRKETAMTRKADGDDTAQDSITDALQESDNPGDPAGDAAPEAPPVAAVAPEASAAPVPAAVPPGNLAEITAQLRHDAAEIAEIAAQAGRLGIAIDAAKALREAITPEALRRLVLDRASAAADARDIVAAPPSPVLPQTRESPIVAAAKRAATAGGRG
ncbi:MAG: S49 family peptidase [Rhodobacteraceae bacterium]|nr:S49 family peptidase [Paracoccaceae bacterium]